MEIIETVKIMPWEITKIINNWGKKQILLKYYSKIPGSNSYNFQKFGQIFCKPEDWEKLLKAVSKEMKEK